MKLRIRYRDREYEVDVEEIDSNKYRVLVEGEVFEIEVPSKSFTETTVAREAIARHREVTPPKIEKPIEIPSTKSFMPTPSTSNAIIAPISGRVLKVLVKPGDTVEPRTVVITLESMKMELEVYAGRRGVIKEIHVKPGDSVRTGQIIATLESH